MTAATYASPVDVERWGAYRIVRDPADPRPLYRIRDRIGSEHFPAEPGRYHVYAGWFCPWAQRVTIEIALNDLFDVIGVSYVDDARDARGWGFRETRGPDPVNGFALLREAYEATEPGFDGHVSVPTLWDRVTGRVVSNEYVTLGLDIATQFGERANAYPAEHRAEIDELDSWIGPAVNQGVGRAADDPAAREALLGAFARLDTLLADRRYLVGPSITEADVRLFVTLLRYDAHANANGRIGAALPEFPNLWAYARDLYTHPAFAATTEFASFSDPDATIPDWTEPTNRAALTPVH